MKLTSRLAIPCLAVFLVCGPVLQAQTHLSATQIFQNAKFSVITIAGSDREAKLQIIGSGFIVAKDRIVTSHHVADKMTAAVAIFSDGTTSTISTVVFDNPPADLVVLQADTNQLPPLQLGDESTLQQGDAVFAIGAPKGLELTLTDGIVSAFRHVDNQFLIQTTAAIAHGSSGGPLFDGAGRVVGIATAFYEDAPGIYLSVGVTDLKRLLMSAQAKGISLSEWSRSLSPLVPEPVQSHPVTQSSYSHGASTLGYQTGNLASWKADKDERTFFIYSESYVYGVTHALGLRAMNRLASIGARNPLATLPLGSEVQFRVQGRYMYILLNDKETMYGIDVANPRR